MSADGSMPRSARTLARQLLKQTNSVTEAAKLLQEHAEKDPNLFRELVEPALPNACYEAVREQCHQERHGVWTAPNYDPGQAGKRVLEHGLSLLDFRLPNGMVLRHAKRADCEVASKFYGEQAKDMGHKSRWLARVADAIGRRTVEAVLSVAALKKLQQETEAQP